MTPCTPVESWRISVVVPVFNEQEGIATLLGAVVPVLERHTPAYEILFVDDGSTDDTLQILRQRHAQDSRVRFISLSRNFGKEAALTAGLEHAQGDAVIPMDVDLQDPPELIPDFIRLWREEGYDMVYGVRASRPDDTMMKRSSAGGFYRLFNRMSHIEIPDNAGDYRLIDRRVVDELLKLPERTRFMKGLYAWVGFRSIGVPYQRPARTMGDSKFNFWKLWNFAIDGFVSFSTVPLRVWSYVGGIIAALALLYIVVIVGQVIITGRDVPGYASLLSVVLFFGAIQLLSIGILGEYLGRLFMESKQRPLYVLKESSPLVPVSPPNDRPSP
ncbi:glycosyltransferase family 2 protein [Halomonas sp. ANAO-440]|uniref:glycosyltransferase family 2 protein n=1 Tax=Halomonas sp. ANAO-440 TaxID=2861360 RepID=UPI001CAA7D22|nr:glycosyltransferase family 2 protein [Halomonas sp. ANAO-440]MBZ0329360.1 glycosyltransferase family 2 protein [Halomonas sp. ANAO-440]